MALFVWNQATGNWNDPNIWGGTGYPGQSTVDTDIAQLFGGPSAATVTVLPGGTFDVAAIDIQGASATAKTRLKIGGTLSTDSLILTGSSGADSIQVLAGGVFDIRTTMTATNNETISVVGNNTTGPGGQLVFGNYAISSSNVTVAFVNGGLGSTNDGTIEFDGYVPGAVTTQKIVNWGIGDSVTFAGANFTGDTYNYDSSTQTLTILNGSTTVLTMENVFPAIGATVVGLSGGTITVMCFAAGTHIRSSAGDQPVETLRPGDLVTVLSADREELQPVEWVGRRRIDLTAHPHPERVAPVRISRGAFAEGVPSRDLLVSPDHAIFADGKLICARQLMNGSTIRQETGLTSVEYFHVELAAHGILLAEGLPAESYLDTGNRGFFANTDMPHILHPDLTSEADHPARETGSCAPFVWQEDDVRPVWEKLAARAAELGQPVPVPETTVDADLAIIANGRTVRPLSVSNGRYQFMVPLGTTELQLVSRAASPADTKPWMEDRRRLGVYVEQIRLRDLDDVTDVPLDHPSLSQGWWAVERSGSELRRWTSGTAVLPLPQLSGPAVLEIAAGSSGLAYRREIEPRGLAA